MQRRSVLPALLAAGAAAPAAPAADWKNDFAKSVYDSFVLHWQDTREYTLAILDAMPAGKFNSKADPAQRTFGEQLLHLAAANTAYFRGFGLLPPPEVPKVDPADKDAVRHAVAAGFDYTSAVLAKIGEAELARTDIAFSPRLPKHSAIDIFFRAYMHTAHHRGQIVTYLRVNGITPPAWKFEPHAG
jgi:uncharacterized damage-inducible protein DinB